MNNNLIHFIQELLNTGLDISISKKDVFAGFTGSAPSFVSQTGSIKIESNETKI